MPRKRQPSNRWFNPQVVIQVARLARVVLEILFHHRL